MSSIEYTLFEYIKKEFEKNDASFDKPISEDLPKKADAN